MIANAYNYTEIGDWAIQSEELILINSPILVVKGK
jgi:hypothetical protein